MTEQAIPELNPGPVVQFDDEGTITSLNWSAFAILGKDVKRGAQVREAIPGMAEVDIAAAIQEGAVTIHIAPVRERFFQFTVRGFKNLGMGGVYGTDVTERLQLEEALAGQVVVRQAEKMAALGKLAAGLAHWLNNPASAATRSANQLMARVAQVHDTMASLHLRGLSTDQWANLANLRERLSEQSLARLPDVDPLEASELEEAAIAWLSDHGVDGGWESGPVLVQAGFGVDGLADLAGHLPDDALGDATAWLAASIETNDLLHGIQETTTTISGVIQAFKTYTYMDQGEIQELNLHAGIDQTLAILQHRLVGVEVVREYADNVPHFMGNGSELNQVWTNLIDNAIDAVRGDGTVRIKTETDGGDVVVVVEDDGMGIPEEEQYRVFEPFYTTKDVGEGTGLGLDIVRRTVEETFGGTVTFTSKPGATAFRVSLPVVRTPNPS